MRQDSEVLSLAVAFGILFVRQFFARENPKPLETLAGTLLGIFYICIPMIFFMRILTAWGGLDGRWVLLYMILVVKITDVGAFFIGCAVGRHKLIPRISPNKSWEGVLGGVVAGVAASVGIWSATGGHIGPLPLRWGDAVALGFLLSVAGVLGDLAESMLKRAAAMKDSGRMIAGMGGLLDVIDSLLPAAPIVYFYVRHIMTHAG
jgi:phosphatidate cytidylyltransferase